MTESELARRGPTGTDSCFERMSSRSQNAKEQLSQLTNKI